MECNPQRTYVDVFGCRPRSGGSSCLAKHTLRHVDRAERIGCHLCLFGTWCYACPRRSIPQSNPATSANRQGVDLFTSSRSYQLSSFPHPAFFLLLRCQDRGQLEPASGQRPNGRPRHACRRLTRAILCSKLSSQPVPELKLIALDKGR